MSPSHRWGLRAAALVVAFVLIAGCAARPPAAISPTAVQPAEPTPAAPVVEAPAATAPATQPPANVAPANVAPRPSNTPVAAAPQPQEPRFGPAWGDRTAYEPGLIATEHAGLSRFRDASEYRIDLRIDDSLTAVLGEQQVRYTNREDAPLEDIYLRLFPNALGGEMNVSDVTVDGAGVTPEFMYKGTAVRVPLPAALPPGESTVLDLKYRIDVPETLDAGYGLLSYTEGILALDTPYAPIPVYDDEGWNVETPPENADTSYNDPSFYLVRVTAPEQLKLVATGVEVARSAADGQQVVTYAQGPARDFFAAASADYMVTTQQVGETRVNAYAMRGEEAAQGLALAAAARALDIYGRRFGPYPYTELDVAATPMLALGIEYPGAVGISQRIYQPDFKPNGSSPEALIESTVAHEVAHQWFYNLVGNDQVDEPWLDEALTQYSTGLYFDDAYGKAAGDTLRANWGSRWDRADREEKPVGLPAREYSQREYSAIVYGRGPLFVAALAERMGQAAFDRFLKDYTARFRWGIATTDEFKALAQQACDCDLSDLFREWLDP